MGHIKFFYRYGDSRVMPATDTVKVEAAGPGQSLVTLADRGGFMRENELSRNGWLMNEGQFFRVVSNLDTDAKLKFRLVVENIGSTLPLVGQGNSRVHNVRGIFSHAKTTIIDDSFAIIGSANLASRRGLYTDWEHSVSFVDAAAVKEYRKRLWADNLRHPNVADLDNLQNALYAWNPVSSWGTPGPVAMPNRPPTDPPLARYFIDIPMPYVPVQPFDDDLRTQVDTFEDADSRERWWLHSQR